VVVDDLIPNSPNLVAGANEDGYHLRNVNLGRDYEADIVADITLAEEGYLCPTCAKPLRASRGVEVGNIFKLGTRYSEDMEASFLDKDGKKQYVIMGSYGIGSGRLLASVAEEFHDEDGLTLPISVAPYAVHLIALKGAETEGDKIYEELLGIGVEVLYDDRKESPGVKFADADIIGIPIRLTVSSRTLKEKGVELKQRDQAESRIVPDSDLVGVVEKEIQSLRDKIADMVVEIPFED
jgi:prolyl-tRNA synthetase